MLKFNAKIDKLFLIKITIKVIVILYVFLIPYIFIYNEKTIADTIGVLLLSFITLGYILWCAFDIKYIFYPDHLFVKGGLFRSSIPYKKISKISNAKDISTGYRLLSSKDAIEIFYSSRFADSVKISPKNKELFISEIKKRCPSAKTD